MNHRAERHVSRGRRGAQAREGILTSEELVRLAEALDERLKHRVRANDTGLYALATAGLLHHVCAPTGPTSYRGSLADRRDRRGSRSKIRPLPLGPILQCHLNVTKRESRLALAASFGCILSFELIRPKKLLTLTKVEPSPLLFKKTVTTAPPAPISLFPCPSCSLCLFLSPFASPLSGDAGADAE